MHRLRRTNRNAEAARSPLENDSTPTYTPIVSTAHTYTDGADSPNDRIRAQNVSIPGCDSVMLPDKTESSLTDTLDVAETSEVGTPRYSKRLSGSPPTTHLRGFVSILPDLCRGWSYSLEDTGCSR